MSVPLPDWLSPVPWLETARNATRAQVEHALGTHEPDTREFAAMISPAAGERLEFLAQRAQALTRRHFGRAISLYAPLYLSNYCPAGCTYCGFASDRRIARHKLSTDELHSELDALKGLGLEEVLLLTGDRLGTAGFPYVRESVKIAAGRFPTVTVEVFPMSEAEYHELTIAGCTGITMYQESYDPVQYERAHRWGEKRDYLHRLDAPSRALSGGIRVVGLGALLGLGDPLFDALSLFRHAVHLRRRFWKGGVAISFPRLRPEPGGYDAEFPVNERLLARLIFAFRICLPDVPLVLSTRESPRFRDGMAGVGISKMSVASRTTVGGYDQKTAASGVQFEVNDHRDIKSFCAALEAKGLQPVFKNWDAAYREEPAPVAAA